MRLRRLVGLFAFILSLVLGDLTLFSLPAYADSHTPEPPAPGCGGIGPPTNANDTDCDTGGIQLTVEYKTSTGKTGVCTNHPVVIMTPSQGDKRSFGADASGKIEARYFHVGSLKLEVTTANSGAGCDPGNGNVYTGSETVTMTKDQFLVHTMVLATETAKSNDADCDVGSFTWVVCPLILDVDKAISWTEQQMTDRLDVQSLKSDGPLNQAWGNFRNLADVFLILIFFIVIFGTALGMDNYTVKKMLPRLIAAAILVQFSFLITQVAVDISNVLGQGVAVLFAGLGGSTGNSSNSGMAILGGGEAALAAITALAAISITPELMFSLLFTLGSALLGLAAAFITLELRQLMIDFLVVLSPVALILWVLPNTEKWYKRWREYLIDLLLMFPIIVILFQVANLFSRIVSTGGSDVSDGQKIIASLIPIIVFFLIPATFKLASKTLSTTSGFINNKFRNPAQSKLADSEFLKRKKEEGQKAGVERLQDLKANGAEQTFGGRRAMRAAGKRAGFGNLRSQNRPEMQRKILGETNKLASEQAELDAIKTTEKRLGVQNFDAMKGSRQNIAQEKLLDNRVAEAGTQTITWKDKLGNDNKTKIAEAVGAVPELDKLIRDSFANGDYATGVAAMQTLTKTTGGRTAARGIRDQVFGATNMTKADTTKFGGNALTYYEKGMSGVSADIAPDLVKPRELAFKGVDERDFNKMDYATQKEYIQYGAQQAAAGAPGISNEAKATVTTALNNPRLSFNADQLKAINDGVSANAGVYGSSVVNLARDKYAAATGGVTNATGAPTVTTAQAGQTLGPVNWAPGGTTTSTPAAPISNAVQTPRSSSTPAPQTSSGTPLVSNTNFGGTSNSTTNNATSNVNNSTTQQGGYTPPSAGRQAATSARLAQPNITVETPQQTINLEASEIGHAVGSEIESIANRTARRSGMAPDQVPVIGQRDTYPPGTIIPPQSQAKLVDPKVEGQDDEPGDERSVS